MATSATLKAMVDAVISLITSAAPELKQVHDGQIAVIPDYPAAAVSVSNAIVVARSTALEDVSADIEVWLYVKDFDNGEVECRALACKVMDALQTARKLMNTAYDNGLGNTGFKMDFGRAQKQGQIPFACCLSFNSRANQIIP